MKRLTYKEIEEINKLHLEGKTNVDLSKMFKVSVETINYHIHPKYNENKRAYKRRWYQDLSTEKKRELYLKQKEYQKKYRKERYHSDVYFREKIKEKAREYKKNA